MFRVAKFDLSLYKVCFMFFNLALMLSIFRRYTFCSKVLLQTKKKVLLLERKTQNAIVTNKYTKYFYHKRRQYAIVANEDTKCLYIMIPFLQQTMFVCSVHVS